MATIGDIISVTVRAEWQLQAVLNVFFYRVMDVPSENWKAGLLTEFQSVVLTPITDIQHPTVVYRDIYCRNIFDGDEWTLDIPNVTGTNQSEAQVLASFMAAHIKLTRSNNRVRHGHKYICGQTEGHAVGQVWESSYQGFLQVAADAMAAPLSAGLGVDVFKPVIVGRVKQTFVDKPPVYRLPVSQEEMADEWSYVSGARADTSVTTMRSRKAGHGV